MEENKTHGIVIGFAVVILFVVSVLLGIISHKADTIESSIDSIGNQISNYHGDREGIQKTTD